MLHSGSQLQQPEDSHDPGVKAPNTTAPDASKPKSHGGKKSSSKTSDTAEVEIGTTRAGKLVPRERFSYWCFDLLLLICSDVAKGTVGHGSSFSSANHKQIESPIGGGLPLCAFR